MLVRDDDEIICWWQVEDIDVSFGKHQHPLFTAPIATKSHHDFNSATNIPKSSPNLIHQRQYNVISETLNHMSFKS